MRLAPLAVVLALAACAGPPDPTAGYEVSGLPPNEAEGARTALWTSDTLVLTNEVPAQRFVGSLALAVAFGPDAHVVTRSFYSHVAGARTTFFADIPIAADDAAVLASSGWNLSFDTEARTGDALHGVITHVDLRADPDGLFFATLGFVGTDGAPLTLTAMGRISPGVCTLWSGGSPTAPADVAACNAIIGELRPPTER